MPLVAATLAMTSTATVRGMRTNTRATIAAVLLSATLLAACGSDGADSQPFDQGGAATEAGEAAELDAGVPETDEEEADEEEFADQFYFSLAGPLFCAVDDASIAISEAAGGSGSVTPEGFDQYRAAATPAHLLASDAYFEFSEAMVAYDWPADVTELTDAQAALTETLSSYHNRLFEASTFEEYFSITPPDESEANLDLEIRQALELPNNAATCAG